MNTMTKHITHPEVLKRLKRAEGHLKSILTMLEEERGCLEVAQQLQAVEKAIGNAKKALVHDHIDHCLENSVRKGARGADDAIREFKEITKYL
jgi:DNA-binding FrmR family transcriptional regulator